MNIFRFWRIRHNNTEPLPCVSETQEIFPSTILRWKGPSSNIRRDVRAVYGPIQSIEQNDTYIFQGIFFGRIVLFYRRIRSGRTQIVLFENCPTVYCCYYTAVS